MLTFEAIDAGHGDAILVRYNGNIGYERILLIDGGPSSTGKHNGKSYKPLEKAIIPRLMQIKAERDKRTKQQDNQAGKANLLIDLVVCTHVHDDHIDGIAALYGAQAGPVPMPDNADQLSMPKLWHNSFSKLMESVDIGAPSIAATQALSLKDGVLLTQYAKNVGTEINEGTGGNLVKAKYQAVAMGPAEIFVLTPGDRELAKLRAEWIREFGADQVAATPAAVHQKVDELFEEDTSVFNLSSISILIKLDEHKILLTGDQRGDFVMEALEEHGFKKADETFHVNILKVPHHGSKANVQKNFIAGVTADIYVFSANGKDQNPDPEVLEIVAGEAAKGRKFTMAFTNGNMNYVPLDGVLPSFVNGPKKIKTLADAITHLKTMEGVAENVNFEFRGANNRLAVKNEHALIYQLTP